MLNLPPYDECGLLTHDNHPSPCDEPESPAVLRSVPAKRLSLRVRFHAWWTTKIFPIVLFYTAYQLAGILISLFVILLYHVMCLMHMNVSFWWWMFLSESFVWLQDLTNETNALAKKELLVCLFICLFVLSSRLVIFFTVSENDWIHCVPHSRVTFELRHNIMFSSF